MQKDKIKVMSVFGTRPEAIKMAPLVKVLENTEEIESIVCVTAQHRQMLDQVLEIFDLHPQYDLNIMQNRQTLAGITTRALIGLEEVIVKERPDIVLVHGDTSTTFAGALAAYYHQIKVGHVEAGLRTYDKYQPFPEEMNRRLTGALTDLHFAPTPLAKEHLQKENISEAGIFITGNTVIDALAHTIEEDYVFHEELLNTIDFQNKRVIAMTAHRRENLGEPLEHICHAVRRIVDAFPDVEVVYAVHKNPAVTEPVYRLLGGHPRIHLTEPLDLKDMHNLMYRSYFVMTDSGGLQEEVPSMGKPVLVLRNVTERPEGIEAGTLKLAGTDEEKIVAMAEELLRDAAAYAAMAQAKNPFGDGNASKRIAAAILYAFERRQERPQDYIVAGGREGHTDSADQPKDKAGNHGGAKEEKTMKEERMAILSMLEKGLITVDEAERLLTVLQNGAGLERDGIGKAVGSALEKAGSVLGSVAKTVGEKAEQLQPKVREVATKVADKADEMQPVVRSAAFRMSEKAQEWKEDARNYKEKRKAKKARDEEEYWDDLDLDDLEADEAVQSAQKQMAVEPAESVEAEKTADAVNVTETAEAVNEVEESDPAMEKYAKNVEAVMSSVQLQMEQIDDAENFLKAAFGDVDPSEWEDEEETPKAEAPKEEGSKEEAEEAPTETKKDEG